jgi:hypothetical protein
MSHQILGFSFNLTPNSVSRASTQINSAVAFAKALYSASVLDLETVACFLALQETKFGPTNIAKPPVERLSSRQPAQSASVKALRKVNDDLLKVIPSCKVSCTYLRIRFAAVQCSVVGACKN